MITVTYRHSHGRKNKLDQAITTFTQIIAKFTESDYGLFIANLTGRTYLPSIDTTGAFHDLELELNQLHDKQEELRGQLDGLSEDSTGSYLKEPLSMTR